jgi:hypothetical protein
VSDEEERLEIPQMYRSMYAEDGRPKVGTSDGQLGARVPGGASRGQDIAPDAQGQVHPGQGGMSVSRSLREIHYLHIPSRLKGLPGIRKARGDAARKVWRMGSGTFASGSVTPDLRMRLETVTHGLVEPSQTTDVAAYQAALAGTQASWEVDER